MAIISPSILAADFANLQRDVQNIADNGGKWVHVDVMDGIFVPNISIGIPVVSALRKVTDLTLDVHLMIDRPIRYVEQFVKAGADWLTIHIEADEIQNTLAALDRIHALGCKAGIVLKPKTPAEAAAPFLAKCDMILVMTVEPGFGGQKFMADQMPKLRQLRQMRRLQWLRKDVDDHGKRDRISAGTGAGGLSARSPEHGRFDADLSGR